MKWISVKDKEPDKTTNILAINEYGLLANIYWDEKAELFYIETGGGWMIRFTDTITLWMPLPDHLALQKGNNK